MSTLSEKLAHSLEVLKTLQDNGIVAIRSKDLTRADRERLTRNGFIQEVIKGWYIPSRPDEATGESTAWYASYWDFSASYLSQRFSHEWCLSPEQSLLLHVGNWTVPKQLLVHASKGDNKITSLPFETSFFNVRYKLPKKSEIIEKKGLKIYSLPSALIKCPHQFFKQNPTDARAVISMISDASQVLSVLLEGGHSMVAGRLAGAFRNIGRDSIADNIVKTMKAAEYDVRENDPFKSPSPILISQRSESPYVNRMRISWHEMREEVLRNFPQLPSRQINLEDYLSRVEEKYIQDAYHSLSIEGYRVNVELIEKVRTGDWDPDLNKNDKKEKNALAARGYWLAFQAVKQSIKTIIQGKNAGEVVKSDHSDWYRNLFSPSVISGILEQKDLAGYRSNQVYIRRSHHVPPNVEAVRDLMPALFDLLKEEQEASVRIVLGHFFFVYIHPYLDGNGRLGRFLMNAMCASGGYSWTIIPVEQRDAYMKALEEASVRQNIKPFCLFLSKLIEI
jgi:hypothetical protein